jgi:hypothetical protein
MLRSTMVARSSVASALFRRFQHSLATFLTSVSALLELKTVTLQTP